MLPARSCFGSRAGGVVPGTINDTGSTSTRGPMACIELLLAHLVPVDMFGILLWVAELHLAFSQQRKSTRPDSPIPISVLLWPQDLLTFYNPTTLGLSLVSLPRRTAHVVPLIWSRDMSWQLEYCILGSCRLTGRNGDNKECEVEFEV